MDNRTTEKRAHRGIGEKYCTDNDCWCHDPAQNPEHEAHNRPGPVQTEVCPVCQTVHDKPLCPVHMGLDGETPHQGLRNDCDMCAPETKAPHFFHNDAPCRHCGKDASEHAVNMQCIGPAVKTKAAPEDIPARDEGETPEEYRRRLQLFGIYTPPPDVPLPLCDCNNDTGCKELRPDQFRCQNEEAERAADPRGAE